MPLHYFKGYQITRISIQIIIRYNDYEWLKRFALSETDACTFCGIKCESFYIYFGAAVAQLIFGVKLRSGGSQ